MNRWRQDANKQGIQTSIRITDLRKTTTRRRWSCSDSNTNNTNNRIENTVKTRGEKTNERTKIWNAVERKKSRRENVQLEQHQSQSSIRMWRNVRGALGRWWWFVHDVHTSDNIKRKWKYSATQREWERKREYASRIVHALHVHITVAVASASVLRYANSAIIYQWFVWLCFFSIFATTILLNSQPHSLDRKRARHSRHFCTASKQELV